MTRFIAFAWDDRDSLGIYNASMLRESLVRQHAWVALSDRAGLAVYAPHRDDEAAVISLHRDAGLICGPLFERSSGTAASRGQSAFGESQTQDILRTCGRSLIDSHWGSYVLFLRGDEERVSRVFRGPAGTLPCYYVADQRLTIFLTQTEDLRWVCPAALTINWDSITAQAAAGDYLARGTALAGVGSIISGECIEIHEGRVTHRAHWNPLQRCSHSIRHFTEAVTLLRQETNRCVSAWASRHEKILLLLSGGLDSSIILSCLRHAPAPARVVAVNFYSEGAGDERRFARSMAQRTHTPLEEIASNLRIDLRDFLRCALTANPPLNFTAFDVEPVCGRLGRHWNATALFTGEMGDDVLGHAPAAEALSEILQRPRALHRFFGASLDYAELTRISLWQAMSLALQNVRWHRRRTISSVYRHRQRSGHLRSSSLISDEAADQYEAMLDRFIHPWFQSTETLPLGKAMLVHSLIKATSAMSQPAFETSDALPMVHPLMSQPLIEVSLRIPSDLHFYRAANGAVARTAFRDALSPEVLERGSAKGTPAAWARSLLQANAPFLSELLLEGILVQRRILDRVKVETLLSKDVNRSRVGIAELIRQIYIELWLRRWAEEGARL